jgi:hypothetical protein
MGAERTRTETQGNQRNEVFATPEEERMNELMMRQREELTPGETDLAKQSMDIIKGVLAGGKGLPEAFSSIFTGITSEMAGEFAQEAIKDLAPQFQSSGMLDSGAAASIAGRTAGDIRRASYESNLDRRSNLLNLGLGFGGQQQQIGQQSQTTIGNMLAGLRNTQSHIQGNQNIVGMNPYVKSFQTSFGSSFGSSLGNSAGSGVSAGAGAAMSSIRYKKDVKSWV